MDKEKFRSEKKVYRVGELFPKEKVDELLKQLPEKIVDRIMDSTTEEDQDLLVTWLYQLFEQGYGNTFIRSHLEKVDVNGIGVKYINNIRKSWDFPQGVYGPKEDGMQWGKIALQMRLEGEHPQEVARATGVHTERQNRLLKKHKSGSL